LISPRQSVNNKKETATSDFFLIIFRIRDFFNIRILTCSFERQIYGLKLKFEIMLHFIYITPEEQYERPYKKKALIG
jgi:hypothetical protein